jgi:hypothetical protein
MIPSWRTHTDRDAGLEEVRSLVFQMTETGTMGKKTIHPCESVDIANSFHRMTGVRTIELKDGC